MDLVRRNGSGPVSTNALRIGLDLHEYHFAASRSGVRPWMGRR